MELKLSMWFRSSRAVCGHTLPKVISQTALDISCKVNRSDEQKEKGSDADRTRDPPVAVVEDLQAGCPNH